MQVINVVCAVHLFADNVGWIHTVRVSLKLPTSSPLIIEF